MTVADSAGGVAERQTIGPNDRDARMFPRLTAEMIDRIVSYGIEETLPGETILFERGQRHVDFFVVITGCIEIFDPGPDGATSVFTTHYSCNFAGEIDLFTGRRVLVSARTGAPSRLLRLSAAGLRRLMTGEPDIGAIITRAFMLRRAGFIEHNHGAVLLIGSGRAGDTLRLQRFIIRNAYPFRLLDTDGDAEAAGMITALGIEPADLPAVLAPGNHVLRNPTNAALADTLGLTETLDPADIFDVAVVGAGPAGLAAGVYAASEGLDTIVVESMAPGGQAGTSSRIENYLGFPTGVSGQTLAARAQMQAQKFGARLAISRAATRLDCGGALYRVMLEDGQSIAARTVIVATGARYRKLDVPHYAIYEGQGIHYAATTMEAKLCANAEVAVVGGGNSAGQAAMFLSRHAVHVHLLVRGPNLAATMSDYLIRGISNSSCITTHFNTAVTALEGDKALQAVRWTHRDTGAETTRPVSNLFVMIGAEPNTQWLSGCVALDAAGFVVTGRDERGLALASPFATTAPGIFAVGDVRSGSIKRVASGVGEGSAVVQGVHHFLTPKAA